MEDINENILTEGNSGQVLSCLFACFLLTGSD